MPLHGSQGNVERFAGRGEMDLVLPAPIAVLKDFFHEAPERLTDRHFLIQGKEAMAVELDKDPFRSPAHADTRSPPATQPGEIKRVIVRQHAVVQARHGKSPDAAPPVENERSS